MEHCRFRNTLGALKECEEHFEDFNKLSEEELDARNALLDLCLNLVHDFACELDVRVDHLPWLPD